jgi:hypothetical protein
MPVYGLKTDVGFDGVGVAENIVPSGPTGGRANSFEKLGRRGGTGNGLAVGNSFVSGGVKGIDGPTGKAETISSACGRPVSYLGMGKPTGLPITPVSLSKVCGGATGKATGPPCINPAPPIGGVNGGLPMFVGGATGLPMAKPGLFLSNSLGPPIGILARASPTGILARGFPNMPPLGPPIDIGGVGLPLTGPLKGTPLPTGKALEIPPPLAGVDFAIPDSLLNKLITLSQYRYIAQTSS